MKVFKFMLIFVIFLVLAVGLFLTKVFYGFSNPTPKSVDVSTSDNRIIRVRFRNESDYKIKKIYLGEVVEKSNSYVSTSYITTFHRIRPGETSGYKTVANIPKGYSLIEIVSDKGNFVINSTPTNSYIPVIYTSLVSWDHPYTNKKHTKKGLVEGDYTFVLSYSGAETNTRNGGLKVKVIKD